MYSFIKRRGALYPNDRYSLSYVENLPELSVVNFDENVEKRSLNANSFYWGILLPSLAETMGEFDLEYVHEVVKKKFNPKMSNSGEVYGGTTTKLNVKQFRAYCEAVEHLIFELGGSIPAHLEQEYADYKGAVK